MVERYSNSEQQLLKVRVLPSFCFKLVASCTCPIVTTHVSGTLKMWNLLNRKEINNQVETKHRHLPPSPRNSVRFHYMQNVTLCYGSFKFHFTEGAIIHEPRTLYVLTDYNSCGISILRHGVCFREAISTVRFSSLCPLQQKCKFSQRTIGWVSARRHRRRESPRSSFKSTFPTKSADTVTRHIIYVVIFKTSLHIYKIVCTTCSRMWSLGLGVLPLPQRETGYNVKLGSPHSPQ